MRYGFAMFAAMLLFLAALMAMVNAPLALGITGTVLIGGLLLLVARWRNL